MLGFIAVLSQDLWDAFKGFVLQLLDPLNPTPRPTKKKQTNIKPARKTPPANFKCKGSDLARTSVSPATHDNLSINRVTITFRGPSDRSRLQLEDAGRLGSSDIGRTRSDALDIP